MVKNRERIGKKIEKVAFFADTENNAKAVSLNHQRKAINSSEKK